MMMMMRAVTTMTAGGAGAASVMMVMTEERRRRTRCQRGGGSEWDVTAEIPLDGKVYEAGRLNLSEIEQQRDNDMNDAMIAAGRTTAIFTGGVGAAMLLAHQKIPFFRDFIRPGGKAGILAMAGIGMFVLRVQLELTARSRSRKWSTVRDRASVERFEAVRRERDAQLSVFDHVVDVFATQHFYLLGGAFAVAAGVIGYKFSSHTHLKVSQRAMHTRVAFQGTAIGIVLAVALANYGARYYKEQQAKRGA
eukprot:g527.t1